MANNTISGSSAVQRELKRQKFAAARRLRDEYLSEMFYSTANTKNWDYDEYNSEVSEITRGLVGEYGCAY